MAEKYGRKVRELLIKELKESFTANRGFITSSVDGIKASDMDVLRKRIKKAGSKYLVIKNRLAKRALEESDMKELVDTVGERKILGISVIKEDPVQVAKILMEFSKENAGFKISDGYFDGEVIVSEKVKELSRLPGRQQLIAMVVGMMNAPVAGFVGVLSSLLRSVVYALNAVKEKKEQK